MNPPALLPTKAADPFVALVKIRSAAVSAPTGVTDIGAIERVNDDSAIARVVVDASAARVRAGAKVTDINKRIVIGADPAAVIDPAANADPESAPGFGRQGRPAYARARITTSLTP